MYRHTKVTEVMVRAQGLLSELFSAYMNDRGLLPEDWKASGGEGEETNVARAVCDYIAGMTDAYAQAEYKRIFHMEFHL